MPFQDIDEESAVGPRAPTRLERLVRKVFVEDWNLKLLSLGITLALWFIVTGQNTPINTHASVQLKFIRPDSLEISNDPPKAVDVLLTGSKHKLDELDRTSLVATIDISDQHAGERVLRLADRAQIALLPEGIKIDAFQPSTVSIRLEPLEDKLLPVKPKLDGNPAQGYEVYAILPSRNTVKVHGAASLIGALKEAPTETISVAGRKESFTATNIAIDISDPKVDLLDPVVNVDIEIGEHRLEKVFSEVPVIAEPGIALLKKTATITLIAPHSIIQELRSTDVRVRVSGNSPPTLELPAAFQGKVVMKSIQPEKFVSR